MKPIAKATSAAVCVFTAWTGATLAQGVTAVPAGSYYSFHSTAQGGCPALDWHVVVGLNGALSGIIAWNTALHRPCGGNRQPTGQNVPNVGHGAGRPEPYGHDIRNNPERWLSSC